MTDSTDSDYMYEELKAFAWIKPRRIVTEGSLDPIEVSGSVSLRTLIRWHESSVEATFMPDLREYLEPTCPEQWCGRSGAEQSETPKLAPRRLTGVFAEDLIAWGVVEPHHSSFPAASFFTVAKKDATLRAIFDCRGINMVVAPPPPLRLIDK